MKIKIRATQVGYKKIMTGVPFVSELKWHPNADGTETQFILPLAKSGLACEPNSGLVTSVDIFTLAIQGRSI